MPSICDTKRLFNIPNGKMLVLPLDSVYYNSYIRSIIQYINDNKRGDSYANIL